MLVKIGMELIYNRSYKGEILYMFEQMEVFLNLKVV